MKTALLLLLVTLAGCPLAGDAGDPGDGTADGGSDHDGSPDPDGSLDPDGGGGCAAGLTRCGGQCVDTAADPANCGACGAPCPNVFNGVRACIDGQCAVGACHAGFGDCDHNPANGCELDVSSDGNHCGSCDVRCVFDHSAPACQDGACVLSCSRGFADCDQQRANGCEVDTDTDVDNCGACGVQCPNVAHGAGGCIGGGCGVGACDAGFGDCDGAPNNGCEAEFARDVMHCGGCGPACPIPNNAAATCDQGQCRFACLPGFADCDHDPGNGCEVDLTGDVGNCGGCGVQCNFAHSAPTCQGGACVLSCNFRFADCDQQRANGCEVDTENDDNNCGACGKVCPQGTGCQRSTCAQWLQRDSGTMQELEAVWGSGPNDVYAVGWAGTIVHSADGGHTWAAQNSGTDKWLLGVWGSGAGDVYAVGTFGTILHTSDGGKTWVAQNSGTTNAFYSVWGSGAGDVYATGTVGLVLHTGDGGKTWTPQSSMALQELQSVWGSSANDVYAVGSLDLVHSVNGGQTWNRQASGALLRAIWGSGAADVYKVGSNGAIFRSVDGGQTWSAQKSGTIETLEGIWGSGPGDVYVVGSGVILHTADHGQTWAPETTTAMGNPGIYGIWGSGAGDVYAVGGGGLILHHHQ